MKEKYSIVIVGAGPAGLTAAIYARRSGADVLVIEKLQPGGQLHLAADIANYPGYDRISGYELAEKMKNQAEELGAEIFYGDAVSVTDGEPIEVKISGGKSVLCDAVILATGATSKKAGLTGEDELVGSGVSYCATCDGAFFKGKDVMVYGSGTHAETDVKYLSAVANKVYVVTEGDKSDALHLDGVEILERSAVVALKGNPLKSVKVYRRDLDTEEEVQVSGLFVAKGYRPQSFLANGLVEINEKGYIVADENTETSNRRIFAAGDVREKKFRQVVTACADGAMAAHMAMREIRAKKLIKK